jgi:hypothetical protein
VRYYSLDTGKGEAASVSIFKDKAGADESVHPAAEYVKEHLSKFITQKPEIIEGPIKLTIERADHLRTACVRVVSQLRILAGKRSELRTRTAATVNASLCTRMIS